MINHDKAYVLGLLIGGGTISNGTFLIKLPFRKWGMNPEIMNKIAVDILTKICDKFQKNYSFPVSYEIGNSVWSINPIGTPDLSELINDLISLSLPTEGFLLDKADLTKSKNQLKGISTENFLSGIFDTRASLTKSHRRFTDEAPVVSLEIPGSTKNFQFVVQLCSWLTDLGSVTDQILYNHPCQHSSADPTYKGWKKGFKIRFLVKSFLAKHSFALQAKAFDIKNLEKYQEKDAQEPCHKRKIRKPSPVCIHSDINSSDLPKEVRNRLFFHYFHFCAVLGCKHAPINELKKVVESYPAYIFVLPRSEKGTKEEMERAFDSLKGKYFTEKELESKTYSVKQILEDEKLKDYLELEQGLAYLFSEKLNGKRHSGSKDAIINSNKNSKVLITKTKFAEGFPLLILNEENDRACVISSLKSELNQRLINEKIQKDELSINITE